MLISLSFLNFGVSESKVVQHKSEIEGMGPPCRPPHRNSAQKPNSNALICGATHLVVKMYDLGSLGGPGPASTPRGTWVGGRYPATPTPVPLEFTHPPHSLHTHTQTHKIANPRREGKTSSPSCFFFSTLLLLGCSALTCQQFANGKLINCAEQGIC